MLVSIYTAKCSTFSLNDDSSNLSTRIYHVAIPRSSCLGCKVHYPCVASLKNHAATRSARGSKIIRRWGRHRDKPNGEEEPFKNDTGNFFTPSQRSRRIFRCLPPALRTQRELSGRTEPRRFPQHRFHHSHRLAKHRGRLGLRELVWDLLALRQRIPHPCARKAPADRETVQRHAEVDPRAEAPGDPGFPASRLWITGSRNLAPSDGFSRETWPTPKRGGDEITISPN